MLPAIIPDALAEGPWGTKLIQSVICYTLYTLHKKEKKNQYMNRVLQLEKGSFVSLVFTTTGGMAPEAKHFIRRIAVLIATKTNEDCSQVMCNMRTRLSMYIMRSVLEAVRGVLGKAKKAWTAPISNVS